MVRKNLKMHVIFFSMLLLHSRKMQFTAGKGLTSWLSFVMFSCVFFHFSMSYPESGVVLDCIDF